MRFIGYLGRKKNVRLPKGSVLRKSLLRKMLSKVSPAEGFKVREYGTKKLGARDLKFFSDALSDIIRVYPKRQWWVIDYLEALKRKVEEKKAIPKVFLNDIDKLYLDLLPDLRRAEEEHADSDDTPF